MFKEDVGKVLELAFNVTDNVALKLPKNLNLNQLPDILNHCVGKKKWINNKFSVEIEEVMINDQLDFFMLYFGRISNINVKEEN